MQNSYHIKELNNKPSKFSYDEVKHLIKIILPNMINLCRTVTSSQDQSIQMIIECIGTDPSIQHEYKYDEEIIADQIDAILDAIYYMYNAVSKKGIDLDILKNYPSIIQLHYESVKEFTEQSMEIKLPDTPSNMSYDEIKFLVKMFFSEIAELCQTVTNSHNEAIHMIITCIEYKIDCISGSQIKAIFNTIQYMYDIVYMKNIDFPAVFNIVHNANMAKRDPITGKFIRREDGKILKPSNWEPPDIVKEIKRQINLI